MDGEFVNDDTPKQRDFMFIWYLFDIIRIEHNVLFTFFIQDWFTLNGNKSTSILGYSVANEEIEIEKTHLYNNALYNIKAVS